LIKNPTVWEKISENRMGGFFWLTLYITEQRRRNSVENELVHKWAQTRTDSLLNLLLMCVSQEYMTVKCGQSMVLCGSTLGHRQRHNLGHLGGGLHSQSLDWYWQTKQYRKIHKLNTSKKQTTQNTAEQNYPGSIASYDTRQDLISCGTYHKAPCCLSPLHSARVKVHS